jgi:hypothetical protein
MDFAIVDLYIFLSIVVPVILGAIVVFWITRKKEERHWKNVLLLTDKIEEAKTR